MGEGYAWDLFYADTIEVWVAVEPEFVWFRMKALVLIIDAGCR
jgi:hypothetical protein